MTHTEFSSRGGKRGTGESKRRSPEHYAKLAGLGVAARLFYAPLVVGAARRTIVKRLSGFDVEITFPAAMMTAALLAETLTPVREITALADAALKFSVKTNAIGQWLSAMRPPASSFVHQPSDLLAAGDQTLSVGRLAIQKPLARN